MIEFEFLKGLPAEGPRAIPFPSGSDAEYREGVVIRFGVGDAAWVGNFRPGGSWFDGVETMPDGKHLLVVARGAGYVIDPMSRSLLEEIGGDICGVLPDAARSLIVLDEGTRLEAIGGQGQVWITDRISWSDLRNLGIEGDQLLGEAFDGLWVPFTVNLDTGEVQGIEKPVEGRIFAEPPRRRSIRNARVFLMLFVPLAIGFSLVWISAVVSLVRGILRADGEATCGGAAGSVLFFPLVLFGWWNVRSTWRDWQVYKRELGRE